MTYQNNTFKHECKNLFPGYYVDPHLWTNQSFNILYHSSQIVMPEKNNLGKNAFTQHTLQLHNQILKTFSL